MRLLILGILLAIPAFFSAGEVALLRLRPSRVQTMVEEGEKKANSIKRLQRRLRRALMVGQLGGTLALVALGWLGKGIAKSFVANEAGSHRIFDISIFLGIVLLATLLSGLIPKALVLNRPELAALQLAPLLEAVMKCLAPLISLLESLATIILKIIGLNSHWDSLAPALSAEELETLIETGGVTGLRPDEKNILEGVFALRDTQVREVMVPRSGMVTLPIDVSFSALMKEVHKTRHARFLVIGESLDDVRGLLDLRQLAEPISRGYMKATTPLAPFLQPVPTVSEKTTLAELMPVIKRGNPLLLVVDEHGGTEGLVTAADLTGEIVGDEIECDNEKPLLNPIEGQLGKWQAAGNIEIIEINRQLNIELPEADEHHTLAGFILERLQHVPATGETFSYERIVFEITTMKGPRIESVKLNLSELNEQLN